MAGKSGVRLNPRHQDLVRAKIQASQIINRLQDCVNGKVELTTVQVQAARILLDKSVSSLSSTELTGHDGGPLGVEIVRYTDPDPKQLDSKVIPDGRVGKVGTGLPPRSPRSP
jgi:hypothetical protein